MNSVQTVITTSGVGMSANLHDFIFPERAHTIVPVIRKALTAQVAEWQERLLLEL